MKALIVVAHGSRKKESVLDVARLCEKISKKLLHTSDKEWSAKKGFDRVEYAFLQFADPLLEAKLEELVKQGVTQIIVFPLFIAVGSHVLSDIPQLVETAGRKYPQVDISITRHLGKVDTLEDLILDEVKTHLNRQA